ncbi:uncharacterized protein LOC129596277 [Paramacrobiotus metropolitanus]|uniref:uncharacterized protein LOC129596277 n=1 Tax=Paramacrobiotus metropolitanus TaxID=2943436 RepID=UPI002445C7B9|nr:uncharacterized protein LOC129596277 [Paramacrobiotus metropolitanus]
MEGTSLSLKIIAEIGQGAFGTVSAAEDLNSKSGLFAVKVIKPDAETAEEWKVVVNDSKTKWESLVALENCYIVRYVQCLLPTTGSNRIAFAMEFCEGGNLQDYLNHEALPLNIATVRRYLHQLLQGLRFLHSNKIVHTDIKSLNIFLRSYNPQCGFASVKIGDLDNPVLKEKTVTSARDIVKGCGTYTYASPELARLLIEITAANSRPIGQKTDIWSLGCVVLDMLERGNHFPFDSRGTDSFGKTFQVDIRMLVLSHLANGGQPLLPAQHCDELLKDFLQHCFRVDAQDRPTASELLQHPLIASSVDDGHSVDQLNQRLVVERVKHRFRVINPVFNAIPDELTNHTTELPGCHLKRKNCGDACLFVLHCQSVASDAEIAFGCSKILQDGARGWVEVVLEGNRPLHGRLFDYIRHLVVKLTIANRYEWCMEDLVALDLPNLVFLTLEDCTGLYIGKTASGTCFFPHLRYLDVYHSTASEIETDAFFILSPSLEYVTLFGGWKDGMTSASTEYMRKFTGAAYQWLYSYCSNNLPVLERPPVWNLGKRNLPLCYETPNLQVRDCLNPGGNVFELRKVLERFPFCSIPVYRLDIVSEAEIAIFDTAVCLSAAESNYGRRSVIKLNFADKADSDQIRFTCESLRAMGKDRPVQLSLPWHSTFSPDSITSVADLIVGCEIRRYHRTDTLHVGHLEMPNLLELQFSYCEHLVICENDLSGFTKMRSLIAKKSPVKSIHRLVFRSLFALDLVALDCGLRVPYTEEEKGHYRLLHNSEEYRWLRECFKKKPWLVTGKSRGEVWRIGNTESDALTIADIFSPEVSPDLFSFNSSDSDDEMAKSRTHSCDSNMRLTTIYTADWLQGKYAGCILEDSHKYGWFGPVYRVTFASTVSAENAEQFANQLTNIARGKPVQITFIQPCFNVMEVVMSAMSALVVAVTLKTALPEVTSHLQNWRLPNLCWLELLECSGVILSIASLSGFPRLRGFVMTQSSVIFIERNVFEHLTELKFIGLDIGIETPMTEDQLAHIEMLHQSADYAWLRTFLEQNPLLTMNKQPGDVFSYENNVGRWTNKQLLHDSAFVSDQKANSLIVQHNPPAPVPSTQQFQVTSIARLF